MRAYVGCREIFRTTESAFRLPFVLTNVMTLSSTLALLCSLLCDSMFDLQKSLRVVEAPPDVVVNKGETAMFVARVSPCMPIPSVFWFFENESAVHETDRYQLVDDDKYRLEITRDGVASLRVVDVDPADAGIYTMSASSSAGTVEVSAVLTVLG